MNNNNSFHLVTPSPWPTVSSVLALDMVASLGLWIHKNITYTIAFTTTLLLITSWNWWQDIHRESTSIGDHAKEVKEGVKMGIILFILSEVFFFLAFFWSFFHSRLSTTSELGFQWPPKEVHGFNPTGVPLLNTIVLLFSGASITWCHLEIENMRLKGVYALFSTILLGVVFTFLQWLEYKEAHFSISDSVYGSRFFIATGFHGLHVIIGSTFLAISLLRLNHLRINNDFMIGFECSAWYWHFVDVVWLFLYTFLYWWRFCHLSTQMYV